MSKKSDDYEREAVGHERDVQNMDSKIAMIEGSIQTEQSRYQTNIAAAQAQADAAKQQGNEQEASVWENKVTTLQATLDQELLKIDARLSEAKATRDKYQSLADAARANEQHAEKMEAIDQANDYAQNANVNDPNTSAQ